MIYTPVAGQPFGHFEAHGYHVTGPNSVERVIDVDARRTPIIMPSLSIPPAALAELKAVVAEMQQGLRAAASTPEAQAGRPAPRCAVGIPTPADSVWQVDFDYGADRYRARFAGNALVFTPQQVQALF